MLKKLLIAAAGLLISAPVLADGGHGRYRHYSNHQHYKHHYRHHQYRPVVVVPPRVIYYPPAPVFYAPSGISVRLNFPL